MLVPTSTGLCLDFIWMPSQEDYLKMWERIKTYPLTFSLFDRFQAIFDEDLLGLRAGGAAYHDDFYAADPAESDSESSEDDE